MANVQQDPAQRYHHNGPQQLSLPPSKNTNFPSSLTYYKNGDNEDYENDTQLAFDTKKEDERNRFDGESNIISSESSNVECSSVAGIAGGYDRMKKQYPHDTNARVMNKYITKRTLILVVVGSMLVIALSSAIIAVVISRSSHGNSTNLPPPSSPNPTYNDNNNTQNYTDSTLSPSDEMAHQLVDGYLQFFVANVLNPIYATEYLYAVYNDTSSPQYLARRWILHNDSLLFDVISQGLSRFLQRYALAILYYSLAGEHWSYTTSDNGDDLASWYYLSHVRKNDSTIYFLLPDVHECNWTGVSCMADINDYNQSMCNKYVETVDQLLNRTENDDNFDQGPYENTPSSSPLNLLPFNNFRRRDTSSSFDQVKRYVEYKLRKKRQFRQRHHDPDGIIDHGRKLQNWYDWNCASTNAPDGVYDVNYTVYRIWLEQMNLTGTMPFEISAIASLKELDLSENNIYGTMEPLDRLKLEYGNQYIAQDIALIDISTNSLSGTIPSSLFSLTNLRHLYLNDNQLEGQIQRRFIRQDIPVEDIWLQNNKFTGTIPSWLDDYGSLKEFILFNNTLTGVIPTVPKSLEYLDVSHNQLTGEIPLSLWSSVNSPANLGWIYLDHNMLTGTLPNTTQSNEYLLMVWLHHNLFNGTVPYGFGYIWKSLEQLKLQYTNVTGILGPTFQYDINNSPIDPLVCVEAWQKILVLEASCSAYPPQVRCDCCTSCMPNETTWQP